MRKRLSLILSWFIATATLSVFSGGASAAGSATLTLSPASGTYTTGDTVSIDIHENSGNVGILAVQADLSYDSSRLSYVSSTMSSTFSSTVQNSNPTPGLICIATAHIDFNATGNTAPLMGDYVVGTVTFKALAPGTATVKLNNTADTCYGGSTGSLINDTSPTPQNVWDEVSTPGSYTINAPVSSGGTSGGTGGTTGSTGTTHTAPKTTPKTPATTPAPTPTTPTPSTPTTSGLKYLVAISVVNGQNKPQAGLKVTLDNQQTATTNGQGIAGFVQVGAGPHTVVVTPKSGKLITQQIVVNQTNSLAIQQFQVHLASSPLAIPKSATLIIIIMTLLVLGLLGYGYIHRLVVKHAGHSDHTPTDPPSAVSSTTRAADEPSILPDLPPETSPLTPGSVVQPTPPTSPSETAQPSSTDQTPTNKEG